MTILDPPESSLRGLAGAMAAVGDASLLQFHWALAVAMSAARTGHTRWPASGLATSDPSKVGNRNSLARLE